MFVMNRRPGLLNQQINGIIWFLGFFLSMPVALSGNETMAAQELEHRAEEVVVPGNPVAKESVEAGLLTRRETLRSSPAFQNDDVPIHLRLAGVLSQQGDPNGAIEE